MSYKLISVKDKSTVKTLSFTIAGISEEQLQKFFKKISHNFKMLENLTLLSRYGQLNNRTIKIFAEGMSKHLSLVNPTLTTLILDFEYNEFSIATSFFESLEKFQNLKTLKLNLRDNYLDENTHLSLGHCLGKLNQLCTLHLNISRTNFTAQSISNLGKGIGQIANLISLKLNMEGQLFLPEYADSFFIHLFDLNQLSYIQIDLWDQYMGDKAYGVVPALYSKVEYQRLIFQPFSLTLMINNNQLKKLLSKYLKDNLKDEYLDFKQYLI
ncbi:hypothetical protein ABPG72_002619 [Tetrahymena utriculariae]